MGAVPDDRRPHRPGLLGIPGARALRRQLMKAKTPVARLVVHTALITGSLLFLFPLIWMISTSLKPIEETMRMPPRLLPSRVMWDTYPRAIMYESNQLGYIPFLRYAL